MSSPDTLGIVTAFYDIGRGDWTTDQGFPTHVHRTTDTYMERFGYLATLDNPMVIYTSPDLVPRIQEVRKNKEDRTIIIPLSFKELFQEKREKIRSIQSLSSYRSSINPSQIFNPEYHSPDYIVVTNLKAFFCAHAIHNNLITQKQVAWLDFGYCRNPEALSGSTLWQYHFTPGKIHLFVFSEYKGEISLKDIVANNIVYVAGAAVVAERSLWPILAQLMNKAADELLQHDLVDDDQTLFLMASLYRPDLFELHKIPDQAWQPVLKMFNNNAVQ